ncbi:MAG: MBOAT family protein, partial [Anaerotignum sp.]|nr:MBOAT family protein [Anaerotignum sp.]
MAFTSFRFIVFLVLAAAAYFLTPKRCRWVTLFVANYVFYFISGGKIFVYLLATTITTYLATVKIGDMAAKNKIAFNEAKAELDKEGKKAWKAAFAKKKKRILIPTVLFNFGILAVLKYSAFVTTNINALFGKFGIGTE